MLEDIFITILKGGKVFSHSRWSALRVTQRHQNERLANLFSAFIKAISNCYLLTFECFASISLNYNTLLLTNSFQRATFCIFHLFRLKLCLTHHSGYEVSNIITTKQPETQSGECHLSSADRRWAERAVKSFVSLSGSQEQQSATITTSPVVKSPSRVNNPSYFWLAAFRLPAVSFQTTQEKSFTRKKKKESEIEFGVELLRHKQDWEMWLLLLLCSSFQYPCRITVDNKRFTTDKIICLINFYGLSISYRCRPQVFQYQLAWQLLLTASL